jgi:hypothetical protein
VVGSEWVVTSRTFRNKTEKDISAIARSIHVTNIARNKFEVWNFKPQNYFWQIYMQTCIYLG